jgi:hypothetical protein
VLKDDLHDRTPQDELAERDELGFQRQPEVRWLTPSLLAKSGVEVVVSGTFGKFADKRELQTQDQSGLTYRVQDSDLWIDYLSDTGDGWNATYTMAWLLARTAITPAGEKQALPRGTVLLLGGDQVYPTADSIAYEDRFIGPFQSALPSSGPGEPPHMYALPGNHDWYDGLVSFLRVFCTKRGWIGGWKTRQRRSYFALEMPNNWWIWAIDIQLDTYIDDVQLDYFNSQPLKAGDNVILLTAKPSWVKAKNGRLEPVSWKYLAFFEDRMIRDRDARLPLVITGDMHHYARFEPEGAGSEEAPTRITAGGGGAYLSATHTLNEGFELQSMSKKQWTDPDEDPRTPAPPPEPEREREPVHYARKAIYPVKEVSEKLGEGIKKLRTLNPEFAQMIGIVHALIALAMLAALRGLPGPLEATDHLSTFLSSAFGPVTLVLIAVLLGGTFSAADIKPVGAEKPGTIKARRAVVAVGHALAHLVTVSLIVFLAIVLLGAIADPDWPEGVLKLARWVTALVALGLAFVAGKYVGTQLWANFMLYVHRSRGAKAPENANQVFTGQSIADYKNFLRMCFHTDGGLTIHPLGVDKICKTWDYKGKEPAGSRFEPRGDSTPVVKRIDAPLRYAADGSPVVAEPVAAPARAAPAAAPPADPPPDPAAP